MADHRASRTLVKSAPELWAECSDARSLARHLDGFGEIRITKLEPETAVAWEGEHASGTVKLEPSGWGTKVTMTVDSGPPAPPEDSVSRSASADTGETAPSHRPTHPAQEWRAGLIARLAAHLWRRPAAGVAELAVLAEVGEMTAGAVAEVAEVGEMTTGAVAEVAEVGEMTTGAVAEPRQPGAAARPERAELSSALDSLGTAHRRPFSRG